MAIERYYSAKEVLAELGICQTTLTRAQQKGEITPCYAGSRRRFAESEILRYLQRKGQQNEDKAISTPQHI